MTRSVIVIGLLGFSLLAAAEEKDKPVIEEVPSTIDEKKPEAPTTPAAPEATAEDTGDSEPVEPETAVEGELDPPEDNLLDLNLSFTTRKWKDSELSGVGMQLTTEWGLRGLPIRLGPSMRYFNLKGNDDFFEEGTLLEFGVRGTWFYDMENFLPYLAIDYTAFSSGSLRGNP